MSRSGRQSYKIVLVGDPRVGKTSIRNQFMGRGFKENYMVTLGADFVVKRFTTEQGEAIVIQIWDLAGQIVFKNVRGGYYKGAEGIILIFDLTRPATFKNIPNWLTEILNQISKLLPIVLVGNKADLKDETNPNHIKTQDALNYAKELSNWCGFDVPYLESSALTGKNIEEIFRLLVDQMETNKQMQLGN